MQCFLVGYRGTCHLSLVFSSYTHSPKGCVYTENTSDAWHIPRYPTRKHCITSIYVRIYVCMCVYMYVCVYVLCMYVCMYVCMCVCTMYARMYVFCLQRVWTSMFVKGRRR